jgi:hypothetical protein
MALFEVNPWFTYYVHRDGARAALREAMAIGREDMTTPQGVCPLGHPLWYRPLVSAYTCYICQPGRSNKEREPMTFTCVKPVAGFEDFTTGGHLVACTNVATHQSTNHAHLKWCAEHVAADIGNTRWIPIDSDQAIAARIEDDRWKAKYQAELAARPRVATRAPIVHTFRSTGEAYDASQTDDTIKDGDVLHVPSEHVTGFLYQAWPMALSTEHGAFHTFIEMPADFGRLGENTMDYTYSADLARSIMRSE